MPTDILYNWKGGETMKKVILHHMTDGTYIGMVTILDYEISLKKSLVEISFPPEESKRKIIVDLALKCGVNQYRFVVFDISAAGKVMWNTSEYIIPNNDIVNVANMYLKENREIVLNSMLPTIKKKEILNV